LLRAYSFIFPEPYHPIAQGIFAKWFQDLIGEQGYTHIWLAILLVFIQALLLNLLCLRFRMSEENNLFPGLFYILLTSSAPDFMVLSPVLIANGFVLLALWNLFSIYRKTDVAANIFNVGMWLAVASLFHFSYILFFIVGIIGISILRALKVAEILTLWMGFLVPFICADFWCFFTNHTSDFWELGFVRNVKFLDFASPNTWLNYSERLYFGILIAISIASVNIYATRKTIQAQKYQTILYCILLFSAITLLFQANLGIEQLLLTTIPLAVFVSYNIQNMSSTVAEATHLLWVLLVLFVQYRNFLI
jgi:hypothetical protein